MKCTQTSPLFWGDRENVTDRLSQVSVKLVYQEIGNCRKLLFSMKETHSSNNKEYHGCTKIKYVIRGCSSNSQNSSLTLQNLSHYALQITHTSASRATVQVLYLFLLLPQLQQHINIFIVIGITRYMPNQLSIFQFPP